MTASKHTADESIEVSTEYKIAFCTAGYLRATEGSPARDFDFWLFPDTESPENYGGDR